MTERAFDTDSHASEFDAYVLSCDEREGKFHTVLDRTLFFPEEGGQYSDTGRLGDALVLHVYERDGIIYHVCDIALSAGECVHGVLDFAQRIRKMQNHTGEHIISGIVHRIYGYKNVGFHLGGDGMTVDFDGELDRCQLDEIEMYANEAVCACLPVKASYPDETELAQMEYRSKRDISGRVRIVQIGEGGSLDCCACCAPHVSNTGEIGIIKILDAIRYKGGVRLSVLCGYDALDDYRQRYLSIYSISTKISAKQSEVCAGVDRLISEAEHMRARISELNRQVRSYRLERIEHVSGNLCLFEDIDDMLQQRGFANEAMKRCDGVCAVFSPDSRGGYRYIIMSRTVDLRSRLSEINGAICGRGGGSADMISGSCTADRDRIERFIEGLV